MKRWSLFLFTLILCFSGIRVEAAQKSDVLRNNLKALDSTIQEVLDRMDQLAKKSQAVSREVQSMKQDKSLGIIDHVRVEGLLARLREILLERRELKKIEQSLRSDREKVRRRLYEVLGQEIRDLLKKGEAVIEKDITAADKIHKAVLRRMEERKHLTAHRPPRIAALPRIDIPDIEGFSQEEQEEIAILLRDDAETLNKKKDELQKERDRLREELQIKQALMRFRGFPRGLKEKPISEQVAELKEQVGRIEAAIQRYEEVVRTLTARSEEIFAHLLDEDEALFR